MKQAIYKSREETLLMKSLSQSQLISQEQLREIKKLYNEEVPYHNFLHALKVAESVLKLPSSEFNIIEIQSLFIAALFHDAWHKWVSENLDEFRSLDLAFQGIIDFEQKYNYQGIDYSIVRKAIIGTVFKNRAINTNKYAIILADLDIASVWMNFDDFLYYADFPFSIESRSSLKKWIKDMSYFKFLMHTNKNIFRNNSVLKIFPKGHSNIKKYMNLEEEKIQKLYIYWRDNNITLREFQNYYNKKVS